MWRRRCAGQRGIVRISPGHEASAGSVPGNDLVGLAFLEDGCAALASQGTRCIMWLWMVEGRKLA